MVVIGSTLRLFLFKVVELEVLPPYLQTLTIRDIENSINKSMIPHIPKSGKKKYFSQVPSYSYIAIDK